MCGLTIYSIYISICVESLYGFSILNKFTSKSLACVMTVFNYVTYVSCLDVLIVIA